VDGQNVRLRDLRGKVVLIDFWATWCAPCIQEIPNVKKAHEQFAKEGLVVLGVSFDRDAATAKKFAAKKNLPWRQIWVEGADKSALARLYGVSAIPAIFLIDREGKVVAKDVRGADLLKAVREAVRKKAVADASPQK